MSHPQVFHSYLSIIASVVRALWKLAATSNSVGQVPGYEMTSPEGEVLGGLQTLILALIGGRGTEEKRSSWDFHPALLWGTST